MLGIKWCELKQGQRINLVNEGNALVNAVLHVSKPDAQGLVKVLIEVFCLNGGKWKTLWITEEHARIQNPETVYRRDIHYALQCKNYKNPNAHAHVQEIKNAIAFAKSKQADQVTASDVADVIVQNVQVNAKAEQESNQELLWWMQAENAAKPVENRVDASPHYYTKELRYNVDE